MQTKPTFPRLGVAQRAEARVRATLMARLQTVQLLQMSERQIAELVKEIEGDPLFLRLLYNPDHAWKVLKFQPHPRTRLSPNFYELNEATLPDGARPEAGQVLNEGREALAVIRRIGQENFEKHFLRAEEEVDRAGLAATLGIGIEDVSRVRDFVLSYSVQSEFFDPPATTGAPGERVIRLARVSLDEDGEPFFEFRSPLLARGRYDIHYERLQGLLRTGSLQPNERRHLRAFIRRLELINWRQNTLYRILDYLCHAQRGYLASRDVLKQTAVTQRELARRLAVAPSTINRAIQGRSLVLPWEEEVLLESLFHSRKSLCLDAMGALEADDAEFRKRTDRDLQERLRERFGYAVPRRTINSYRRSIGAGRRAPPPSSAPETPSAA